LCVPINANDFQKAVLEFRVNNRLEATNKEGGKVDPVTKLNDNSIKRSNSTIMNRLLKRTCSPTEEKLPLVFA